MKKLLIVLLALLAAAAFFVPAAGMAVDDDGDWLVNGHKFIPAAGEVLVGASFKLDAVGNVTASMDFSQSVYAGFGVGPDFKQKITTKFVAPLGYSVDVYQGDVTALAWPDYDSASTKFYLVGSFKNGVLTGMKLSANKNAFVLVCRKTASVAPATMSTEILPLVLQLGVDEVGRDYVNYTVCK